MEQVFKFIIDSRKAFIRLIDQLSLEELNTIPKGFNNNIIWNFGHIVVSTPLLCYVRTGVWPDSSPIQYVETYRKGTKPTYFVPQQEIDALKALAISSILQIEDDYKRDVFKQIAPFDTATFGVLIDNIEELLVTTTGHDNTHFGYAIAQRRALDFEKSSSGTLESEG